MSLSPDDVQAIGALLDQKLERIQTTERKRRRFWVWFWILVFILSSVASWFVTQHYIAQFQAQLAQADDEMRSAKLAYQAELKRSAQMQAERKAAEEASHYQSKQSQASYEAGLISSLFKMQAEAAALHKDLDQKADVPSKGMRTEQDAIDQLDDSMADLKRTESLVSSASGILMQMLLRNTDPEHNSVEDKLVGSEAEGAPAKPEKEPALGTVAPAPAPQPPASSPAQP